MKNLLFALGTLLFVNVSFAQSSTTTQTTPSTSTEVKTVPAKKPMKTKKAKPASSTTSEKSTKEHTESATAHHHDGDNGHAHHAEGAKHEANEHGEGHAKKMVLKDHVCTAACKDGNHVYAHGEKGHVCGAACHKPSDKMKSTTNKPAKTAGTDNSKN